MGVGEFFLPSVGTGLEYAVYLGINAAAITFGVSFPSLFFAHRKKRKDGKWPKKWLFIGLSVSAGITVLLMWLCYCAVNDLQGSIYDLAQRLVRALDPVLGVRRLVSDPVDGFFGINLSLRVAAACFTGFAVLLSWKGSDRSAEQFAQYLDRKFLSQKGAEDGKEPPENAEKPSQSDGTPPTDGEDGKEPPEKDPKPSQGDGASHWDALQSKLGTLLASGSGIGLLAYIFGPKETQDGIEEILKAVVELLEKVTLLSQVDPGATGLAAFFTKSLFVVLSIFMLGIYVAVILLLVAFIQAIILNRAKIVDWIVKKRKILWTCLGVVLLAAAACAALVAMSYAIKNGGPFIQTFQGGALGIFVSNFAVLSIAVCAVLLMLIFVLAFVILASDYALQLVWELIRQWHKTSWAAPKGGRNAGRAAGMLVGVFVWAALLVAAGWGYPQMQAWLEDLFSNKDPLQLLGRFGLLTLMIEGGLAIAAAGLLLALLMLQSMVVLFEEKGDLIINRAALLLKSVLLRTVEFFSLLPFVVEHACKALRSVLYTILQIFIGYRNESEKNSAIFTAACFASLASLLNTFFGLKGFYDASGHLELILCSAAIACAVQLAMLIFGMKAGEGLAEKRFMLGPRRKKGGANAGPAQELSGERLSVPGPRRLPYFWYLIAYLLLMVVSTGFAFNNMFGYYASTSHVHERVYDQVRYKADEELQLSQTIGALISEYNTNTGALLELFSQRAEETGKVRMAIETSYRNTAAEAGATEAAANDRDRFIGKTRDLEIQVAAIKSFIGADYESIGKNATVHVEEYDHYWGGRDQPYYRTGCIIIYYEGVDNDEKKTTVGSYLDPNTPKITGLTVKDKDNNDVRITFKIARYTDPDSDSQSIIKLPLKEFDKKDKYGILRELIGQYEQLENRIYDDTKFSTIGSEHERPKQSIGVLLNEGLTRNAELDGIRANIVELCRTSDGGADAPADGGAVSMQDLRQIANDYLNQDILRKSGEESGPGAAGQEAGQRTESKETEPKETEPKETEPKEQAFDALTAYIDRALSLYNILAGYTDGTGTDAEDSQDMDVSKLSVELLGANEPKGSGGVSPAGSDSAGLTVRKFRNYAQGLTYSNFQISYDALIRGWLGLNPVRKNVDALYSSMAVAWFILFICIIVDMMAFFAGLLLFKDIYLFRKNNLIEEIGYLNYETALSGLFAVPKESRERVLVLAAVYKLLYGDAAGDSGAPDEDTGSAEEGEPPDENTGSAEDGGTPDEDTNSAGDGETPDEDAGSAGDSETPDENTGSAGDGETSDEDTGSAGGGEIPDEDTGAAGDGEASGEAEKEEEVPQAPAEASKETDPQVVLAKRMREILRSEDFKKFYRKVELVLRVLEISEDEETGYGMFLLWLRSYAERNNLDFDEVFLSDDK